MANSTSIQYIYYIRDKYTSAMSKMTKVSQAFNKATQTTKQKLGALENKFKTMGSNLANLQTGLAALGAGRILQGALDQAVEFGDGIARIGTLIPGQEARLESLKSTVTDMAVSMGLDMNDVAAGTFDVISAFGDLEGETEGRMKAVASASVAGGASMSDSLSLLSAVTKSYGDTSAEALQKASDLAFMTNVLGQTTFPEMAASMGKVLPLTAKMAVSQEEVFAAMATLTGVTGNTAEVSTQLSAIMSAMIKPTDGMKTAIEKLGFSSVSAMVKEKGLADSLNMLNDVTGGSEEAIGELFGSKEAMTAFFALTGAQADKFTESLDAMGDAAASNGQTTQEALNEMTKSPGQGMREMTASFQALQVTMGDILAETITPMVKKVSELSSKLRQGNPIIMKMITYFLIGVTVLGAVIIPLGLMISSIGTVIGVIKSVTFFTKLWTLAQTAINAVMAANPIALVVIGIAALIVYIILLIKYWDQVKAFALEHKNLLAFVFGPLGLIINTIMTIRDNWGKVVSAFKDEGIIAGIKAIGSAIFNGIVAPFKQAWDILQKVLGGISGLDIGGKIKGLFGFGSDEEPTSFSGTGQTATVPNQSGANANATASVSVYTEQGMGVVPFESSGNRGYNMQETYQRAQ